MKLKVPSGPIPTVVALQAPELRRLSALLSSRVRMAGTETAPFAAVDPDTSDTFRKGFTQAGNGTLDLSACTG